MWSLGMYVAWTTPWPFLRSVMVRSNTAIMLFGISSADRIQNGVSSQRSFAGWTRPPESVFFFSGRTWTVPLRSISNCMWKKENRLHISESARLAARPADLRRSNRTLRESAGRRQNTGLPFVTWRAVKSTCTTFRRSTTRRPRTTNGGVNVDFLSSFTTSINPAIY